MHDEMLALRKTMLRERQAALRQLLESERLMFEEELNAMGLAIDKYSF